MKREILGCGSYIGRNVGKALSSKAVAAAARLDVRTALQALQSRILLAQLGHRPRQLRHPAGRSDGGDLGAAIQTILERPAGVE